MRTNKTKGKKVTEIREAERKKKKNKGLRQIRNTYNRI